MTRPFRVAIVGCGRIAVRHARAATGLPHVELTALVDSVRERASALAAELHVDCRQAATVGEVLDAVDGVVIATPNQQHALVAVECLEAGVPVLVEKPLATSIGEGEAICRAAEKTGARAAVGYVTRFRESVQLMKGALESRYFGAIGRFAYQYGSRGGWAPLSGYHLDRRAAGGGVLVVTGTHFLDRLLYWFGYPDRVALVHDSLGGPEANAAAEFEYATGEECFRGVARFSKTAELPSGFVMETEAGTVHLGEGSDDAIRWWPVDRPELEMVLGRRAAGREAHAPAGSPDLFRRQLEDFVDAVVSGRDPMVPAREGLESLRLLNELYATASAMPRDWYESSRREAALT